jgi:hypothetical protein
MAPSSGYYSKRINAGLVQSSGWEIELHTAPVETSDLKWNVDITFTRNRTKIKELTPGMDFITLYSMDGAYARTWVGQDIGDIWGQDYVRVDDPASPYHGWPLLYGNLNAGYMLNFLGTDESMIKIGNFNHDFLTGISTTISYKSFTLNALFDWRQGGDFFSATQRRWLNLGLLDESFQGVPYNDAGNLPDEIKANPDRYLGNWVGGQNRELGGFPFPPHSVNYPYNESMPYSAGFVPGVYLDANGNYVENLGDPATTGFQATGNVVGNNLWPHTAYYIYNASYLKLREISLTFHFPQKWITPAYIQRLGLSVFCRNLILWTANKISVDPERAFNITGGSLQQGIEKYNMMPWTLSFGAKLNIEF